MGLFRSRAKKKRAEAAAEPPMEQATTANAQPEAEVEPRKVSAEARPNPDTPGWGRSIGQQIGKARENQVGQD